MDRETGQTPSLGQAIRVAAGCVVIAASAAAFWGVSKVDLGRHAFLGDRQNLYDQSSVAQTAEVAQRRARSIDRAFEDAQDFWAGTFRDRSDKSYRHADLRFFSRSSPSPCAGSGGATGHFYCPANSIASFDLVFAEEMSQRTRQNADRGEALMVGYIVASHVQRQAGTAGPLARQQQVSSPANGNASDRALALNADCLTGVWAASASGRIGVVQSGFYAQALSSARSADLALRQYGADAPVSLNRLGTGDVVGRDSAFMAGYRGADPSTCAGL